MRGIIAGIKKKEDKGENEKIIEEVQIRKTVLRKDWKIVTTYKIIRELYKKIIKQSKCIL